MSDDWEVPCSDEDDDSNSYMPPPKTIVELYNRLDKGEVSKIALYFTKQDNNKTWKFWFLKTRKYVWCFGYTETQK